MGDVLTLVEKAQATFDEDEAKKLEKKVRKEGIDLQDFLAAMRQIQKLGPLEGVLKMLPGVNTKMLKQANVDPQAAQASRGDRAVDDRRGAHRPRRSSMGRGGRGWRRARGGRSARSIGCSSSSGTCRR